MLYINIYLNKFNINHSNDCIFLSYLHSILLGMLGYKYHDTANIHQYTRYNSLNFYKFGMERYNYNIINMGMFYSMYLMDMTLDNFLSSYGNMCHLRRLNIEMVMNIICKGMYICNKCCYHCNIEVDKLLNNHK
jgi:hypothetical protein